MWLIILNDRTEFCYMKAAQNHLAANNYLQTLYDKGTKIEFQFMDKNHYRIIINGTEEGFLGWVEVI